MPSQSQHALRLPWQSLYTPLQRGSSPAVLTSFRPPTLDERSRELSTHSRVLRWQAERARQDSKQLQERIRHNWLRVMKIVLTYWPNPNR